MDDNIISTSESEQMYLLSVAMINETGQEQPISISRLAEKLRVIPVSAHQMVKKLSKKGLLNYEPYKGVSLTLKGSQIAQRVLRSRRLWSVFLTEKLNLSPKEADELACHLEHHTTPELSERLATYLNNPRTDPLGNPIPDGKLAPNLNQGVQLTNLNIGSKAKILRIPGEKNTRAFLKNVGLIPGAEIQLQGLGEGNELLLKINNHNVYLSPDVAAQINIQKLNKTIPKGTASAYDKQQ
ncbi:MAG TPA: metal-dependent transcriptional regulator [Anaerolineae bacterium]|nr:metal-dependent transcriptional regulator [Anaerolineae bacterium]